MGEMYDAEDIERQVEDIEEQEDALRSAAHAQSRRSMDAQELMAKHKIQPAPGKQRYQVFMDSARSGNFECVADFADASEAQRSLESLQNGHMYADVVVFDTEQGTVSRQQG